MTSRAYRGIISPEATKDLDAVSAGLREYGPEVRQRFMDAGRKQLAPAYAEELAKRTAYNKTQRDIVAADPQVVVGAVPGGVAVIAATGGRGPLGFLTRAYEFGTLNQNEYNEVHRRGGLRIQAGAVVSAGTTYVRRTKRQIPTRSQTGWLAYPAAGAFSGRVYKMLMQILVLVGHNAVEGKRG